MPRSFRRIDAVPPYAFAAVDALKQELRREGRDVVDLGFGNPDIASPTIAVEKLREAAGKARNHRYSASRGIPKLREAICDLYRRRFGVELDPETQALTTIGAKEGLTHLMWVLLEPGDTAVVPTPSYPIHQFAPFFTGLMLAAPKAFIAALAGLAMLRVLQTAFTVSFRDRFALGALVTFLVTVADIPILNIGAPFWGLVFGYGASRLLERSDFPARG